MGLFCDVCSDLTVRNILDELVSIFSVDAVFFKQKPIKALVKTTAFIALQEVNDDSIATYPHKPIVSP